MKVTFSVNDYDMDGDLIEACVYLNLNDAISIKFETVEELGAFIKKAEKCRKEICGEAEWQQPQAR